MDSSEELEGEKPGEAEMKENLSDKDTKEEETVREDHVSNKDSVVFKTPSFTIPSKIKVQNQKDSVFAFKAPMNLPSKGSRISREKAEIESNVNQKSDSDSKDPDSASEQTDRKTELDKTSKVTGLLPAEQIRQAQTAVPYKEPPWSAICKEKYSLEVIKNGSIIEKIDLDSKAFYVIGRLPSCNIPMEHPSMSRYHAVLQYSNGTAENYVQGWYLYDLDSTHGTWINKNRVPPLKFHRIHVDFCLKFGGSTRLFILQGPDEDREEESELSVKEMVEQREKQKKEAELLRQAEIEETQRKMELLKKQEEARGCSWGINDEEVEDEEEEDGENPFAITDNEELYIDDPKKSLNGYFEREGLDPPQYEFSEAGFGKWKCSVELPLDTPSGEPMVAEVIQSGKKREAVVACALDACRILDRHGVLRQSTHESKKRKQKNWEQDDYYDSDEDVYLDRTGTIEKKREFRKSKVGKTDKKTDTYESLMERHSAIVNEMKEIEEKLEHAKAQAAAMDSEDVDALDAYMKAIKSGMMDSRTKMSLKRRMMELRQEEQKVRKLVNITKPASLPELQTGVTKAVTSGLAAGATVGKMKGSNIGKLQRKPLVSVNTLTKESDSKKEEEFKEEVEEDEEMEEDSKEKVNEINETRQTVKLMETVKEKTVSNNTGLASKSKPSEIKVDEKKDISQEPVKSRVKGPTLPLAAVLEKLKQESESMDTDNNEMSTQTDLAEKKSKPKFKKQKLTGSGMDPDDPDYTSWIPPENQVGDGKTFLNAKYGY